jgi:hypothetical protein
MVIMNAVQSVRTISFGHITGNPGTSLCMHGTYGSPPTSASAWQTVLATLASRDGVMSSRMVSRMLGRVSIAAMAAATTPRTKALLSMTSAIFGLENV